MKKLSKEEMKNVMGGVAQPVYTCTCAGSGGQWIYPGGDRPSQETIDRDISESCNSGSASCIFAVPNVV